MNFENYKKYGKCAVLRKGGKKMLVTLDLGPRIIFYGFDNGENIFFEDLNDEINRNSDFIEKNLPDKGIWHIYGGHRLWKSPEYEDTYYPDNAPVSVTQEEDSFIFVSEDEKTTGLKKSLKVTMSADGNATVEHKLTNAGTETTPPLAVWALSVMDKGAVAEIPLSTTDKGLLPNRNLVLWSYSDLNDERFTLSNDKIILRQQNKDGAFKIGAYVQNAVSVFIKGMIFKIENGSYEGTFADYYCNTECYTCDKMLEIETLSPLSVLSPGESVSHTEKWSLCKQSGSDDL